MNHARKFQGVVHRASQQCEDRKRNLVRRYATVENAFSRMYDFMIRNGYVGDVIEISSIDFGYQVGTIKMNVKGRISTNLNEKLVKDQS